MDNSTSVNLEVINNNLELKAKFQKKKNEVRKELNERGILPKGAHNDYDNYDYFSEAQYKELFTELFSKHGIEFRTDELQYISFNGTDKQPFGRMVTIEFILIDIETGYEETSKHTGEGLDRGDKAGYKATTGALKKFLSSTFLVATKDDPEREDEKTTSKKTEYKKSIKKGTVTPGQLEEIKKLFETDKDELIRILISCKKKNIKELTLEEASKIISKKKEGK